MAPPPTPGRFPTGRAVPMQRRPRRIRGAAVWLSAVVAIAAWSMPLGAQETFDEGFFEVYVQRIPTRITVTTLVDARGRVLIPLRPVVEHVGIPLKSESGTFVLEWPPGAWRTVLDRSARTITVGGETDTIPAEEWVERGGEVYVSSGVLARVLAAHVDIDWAGLGIVVSQSSEFPATRRLEREARRERERLAAERMATTEVPLAFEPRSGGVTGTWGLALSGAEGVYRGALRSGVGGSLWGGATELGGTFSFGDHVGDAVNEGYARYSRVFPNATLVRQLQVGSVLSGGPVARRLVGATLTNEPYTTPRYFADALIQPSVPSGWEYEVYQGETLVGVSSGDEPANLHAPLNYGNTPVRVRMIGPAGEERVEQLLYVVPPTRIPFGEWRYDLGVGSCRDPSCDAYAYGEVKRGVTPWMTAGFGVDRLDPAEGRVRVRPWGYLGVSPLQALSVDVQSQPGSFLQANVSWATVDRGVFGGSWAWTRPTGDAPTLDGWYGQLTAAVPMNVLGGRTVSGRLLLRGTETGKTDSWQANLATTLRRSYVSADWESGLQARRVLTARAFTPIASPTATYLRDLATSVGLAATSRGPEFLELGVSFRPSPTGSLSLSLRAGRGAPALLSIGFVTRRPEGYFQARAARGSSAGLFLAGDGGVTWDPETGVVPLPFQSLGRSGIRGRVYYDVDGDGVDGPGDLPAPDVDVVVRGDRVTTDATGSYHTWEVRPYDVVRVAVDSLSIDPSWVPAPREVLLRPSPNLFNEVSLPLRRTREVSGSVELGGDTPHPLAGVAVEVRDASGRLIASERTFSDGVYYFQRIPPGRYTIGLARASLDALGAPDTPPVPLEIAGGTDAPVEVPLLRVEPGGGP